MVNLERFDEGGILIFNFNRTTQNLFEYSLEINRHIRRQYGDDIASKIVQEQTAVEAEGKSFNTFAALERFIGSDEVENFKLQFMDYARERNLTFLNPGVEEVFRNLKKEKIAHAIVTAGIKETQEYQLQISGLSYIPHLITDRSDIAKMMVDDRWFEQDGRIKVPAELAMGGVGVFSYLFLVDDKSVAFHGAPRGEWIYGSPRGFFGNHFIDRRYQQLRSQEGRVPSGIATIHNIRDIHVPRQLPEAA